MRRAENPCPPRTRHTCDECHHQQQRPLLLLVLMRRRHAASPQVDFASLIPPPLCHQTPLEMHARNLGRLLKRMGEEQNQSCSLQNQRHWSRYCCYCCCCCCCYFLSCWGFLEALHVTTAWQPGLGFVSGILTHSPSVNRTRNVNKPSARSEVRLHLSTLFSWRHIPQPFCVYAIVYFDDVHIIPREHVHVRIPTRTWSQTNNNCAPKS